LWWLGIGIGLSIPGFIIVAAGQSISVFVAIERRLREFRDILQRDKAK
jgi:hypothetical protein